MSDGANLPAPSGESAAEPKGSDRDLLPWEQAFCMRAATWGDRRVSKREQLDLANALKGSQVSYKALRILKARPAYGKLLDALRTGGREAAKAMFEGQLTNYVDLHMWGAQRAKEKDDVRALPSFTVPALDRIAPKTPNAVMATAVTISLTPRQMHALTAPEYEVLEAEVLPSEPATGDDGERYDAGDDGALSGHELSAQRLLRALEADARRPRPFDRDAPESESDPTAEDETP